MLSSCPDFLYLFMYHELYFLKIYSKETYMEWDRNFIMKFIHF